MDNNSPPTDVQARPVVIPTKSSFSISSLWYNGTPSKSNRLSFVLDTDLVSFFSIKDS